MFDITFLGTAASTPSPERGLPAVLAAAGSERFLIDCGEGTQRQLLRAGAGFRRLGHILLTHAHLDHVLGLAGLIATMGLFDLRDEVAICGSAQTIGLVERYLSSLWPNRIAPVPLRFVILQPGRVMQAKTYAVTCFPVQHRGTESLGFRFEALPRRRLRADRLAALDVPEGPLRARLAAGEPVVLPDGRRITAADVEAPPVPATSLAIVGDAEEIDTLVPAVAGATALVIEATFLEADAALAVARGHLTAAQAGRLAAAAGVGTLYLTHLSGRYDPVSVEAEARRFFSNAIAVNDFDRFSVSAPHQAAADRSTSPASKGQPLLSARLVG